MSERIIKNKLKHYKELKYKAEQDILGFEVKIRAMERDKMSGKNLAGIEQAIGQMRGMKKAAEMFLATLDDVIIEQYEQDKKNKEKDSK